MIITLSGRRVKRPRKNLARAKSCIAWGYRLTESGKAAMNEAESFAAYQANLYSEGMNCTALIAEVQRCYEITLRTGHYSDYPADGSFTRVDFEGNLTGDWACVSVTGDPGNPFQSVGRGWAVHLPPEAFERAAQLWLALHQGALRPGQEGKDAS